MYPQAPWKLKGHGFLTLHWVDIDRVRPFVPSHLRIFSFFPGKTLGGAYVGAYGDGSTLQYSELISVPALIYHQGKIGTWISHIYVDNPDSMAGGRAIWGLPKEIAQFEWETASSVTVKQGDRPLCNLRSHWNLSGLEHPVQIPAFSLPNSQLMQFSGQGSLKWHWAGIDLKIPIESPIADLGLGQPWLTILLSSLNLNVNSPSIA
jgi:acetoacetate decarboxylase